MGSDVVFLKMMQTSNADVKENALRWTRTELEAFKKKPADLNCVAPAVFYTHLDVWINAGLEEWLSGGITYKPITLPPKNLSVIHDLSAGLEI